MKSVNQLAASWKFDWITAAFTQTKTLTYWFNLDAAFLSPSTLYFILIIIYWRWYRMTLILLRSSILIDVNCLTIMSSSKRFKMESFASLSLVCSLKKYNLGSTMGSWATSSPWQLPSQHYSTSHWHWIRSSKHSTSASFLPLLWFFSMTVSRDVNSRCKQASLSASREAATVAKAKLWQNLYLPDLNLIPLFVLKEKRARVFVTKNRHCLKGDMFCVSCCSPPCGNHVSVHPSIF